MANEGDALRTTPYSLFAIRYSLIWSAGHHAQRFVDRAQHAVELVSAAHDETGRRDDAVGALPTRQFRALLDAVDRNLAGASKHGKHRAVLEEIDGVVAPFTGGDLAAVETEDAVELAPVEGHSACGGEGRSAWGLAPVQLARFCFGGVHAAPPCV